MTEQEHGIERNKRNRQCKINESENMASRDSGR